MSGQLAVAIVLLVALYGVVPFVQIRRRRRAQRAIILALWGICSPPELLRLRITRAFVEFGRAVTPALQRFAVSVNEAASALSEMAEAWWVARTSEEDQS